MNVNFLEQFFVKIQDLLAYDRLLPLFLEYKLNDLISFALVSDLIEIRSLAVSFLMNLTEFDIDLVLDYDDLIKTSPHYISKILYKLYRLIFRCKQICHRIRK